MFFFVMLSSYTQSLLPPYLYFLRNYIILASKNYAFSMEYGLIDLMHNS